MKHLITIFKTLCYSGMLFIAFSGCKIYRFKDVSVDPNIKTFTINTFNNTARIRAANLNTDLTENLKRKFLRETNLVLAQSNGDVEYSGTIIDYSIDPASVTSTQTLSQNRLTISVKIECVNKIDPTKSYTQTYTDGENYDASKDISTYVDVTVAKTITDRIIQNIFTKSFSNW